MQVVTTMVNMLLTASTNFEPMPMLTHFKFGVVIFDHIKYICAKMVHKIVTSKVRLINPNST